MNKYYFLLLLFFAGLVWSGIHPRNYSHWIGEVAPPLIGLIIFVSSFKRFRYSYFTYVAILLSCYLMFIGAHYTFSKVPLFDWIRDYFGQDRNNFDKLGHFVQGILPVLISRELFIRKKIILGYKWVTFLSFCICLSTTVVYEVVEFLAVTIAGKSPDTFLGTQGYALDSQSDMFFAVIGGLLTIFFLRKAHDRIIEKEFPGTFFEFLSAASEKNASLR